MGTSSPKQFWLDTLPEVLTDSCGSGTGRSSVIISDTHTKHRPTIVHAKCPAAGFQQCTLTTMLVVTRPTKDCLHSWEFSGGDGENMQKLRSCGFRWTRTPHTGVRPFVSPARHSALTAPHVTLTVQFSGLRGRHFLLSLYGVNKRKIKKKCLSVYGVHIGATWRIWLNRPCAAAMRPYVKLLWPLVSFENYVQLKIVQRQLLNCWQ